MDNNNIVYKSYCQRWWILASVVVLNIANNSHWISFAAVHSKAAEFYQVSNIEIQLIVTLSYGLGVPCACAATFILARYGLKPGLILGALLTMIGGLICCISTFPGLRDLTYPRIWYWMTLTGQAITGMANPLIASVPTKISQHWFNEEQRFFATALLGLSNCIGLVVSQAFSPLIVRSAKDLPLMNIIWFSPAAVGALLTFASVTRSKPPTPPTKSAALETEASLRYLDTVKLLAKNKPYITLILITGGAMGYISALQAKNEQILCSLGYSNRISGICAALVFVGGVLGSVILGYGFARVKNEVFWSKLICLPLATSLIAMMFLQRMPHLEILIGLAYAIMGFLAIGIYPVLLEMSVEATFPADESIAIAILYVSNSLFGVCLMYLDELLAIDIDETDSRHFNETCSATLEGSKGRPMNHDLYVFALNGFGIALLVTYVMFFDTKLKRTEANLESTSEEIKKERPIYSICS